MRDYITSMIAVVLITMGILATLYLVAAFAAWSWSPAEWANGIRLFISGVGLYALWHLASAAAGAWR